MSTKSCPSNKGLINEIRMYEIIIKGYDNIKKAQTESIYIKSMLFLSGSVNIFSTNNCF